MPLLRALRQRASTSSPANRRSFPRGIGVGSAASCRTGACSAVICRRHPVRAAGPAHGRERAHRGSRLRGPPVIIATISFCWIAAGPISSASCRSIAGACFSRPGTPTCRRRACAASSATGAGWPSLRRCRSACRRPGRAAARAAGQKSTDVFFTGRIDDSSSIRARGLAELQALRQRGLLWTSPIRPCAGRVLSALRRRLAGLVARGPRLGLLPALRSARVLVGAGHQSPDHRALPAVVSDRHALYYDPEPGGLTRTVVAALGVTSHGWRAWRRPRAPISSPITPARRWRVMSSRRRLASTTPGATWAAGQPNWRRLRRSSCVSWQILRSVRAATAADHRTIAAPFPGYRTPQW